MMGMHLLNALDCAGLKALVAEALIAESPLPRAEGLRGASESGSDVGLVDGLEWLDRAARARQLLVDRHLAPHHNGGSRPHA